MELLKNEGVVVMRKFIVILCFLCFTSHIQAQPQSKNAESQSVLNQLSDEVALINAAITETENQTQMLGLPPTMKHDREKALLELVLKKLSELKQRYEENPYVRIGGFSVNLGTSMSVSIGIEIKK